jgi:dCMP deaminase
MRPDWDEYFLAFLPVIAKRATCNRGRAACLIAKENRVISTGYVGSISGEPHCDDIGHLMVKQLNEDGSVSDHCRRTQHCELNAIAQAAKYGTSINGATIYITMEPCFVCAKMLVQCGIKRVVAIKKYHRAQLSRELLKNANVELKIIEDCEENYE